MTCTAFGTHADMKLCAPSFLTKTRPYSRKLPIGIWIDAKRVERAVTGDSSLVIPSGWSLEEVKMGNAPDYLYHLHHRCGFRSTWAYSFACDQTHIFTLIKIHRCKEK